MKRKHNKNDQHLPSESSDSKEEAVPEADLTMAWPGKKKEKENSKKREREKGDTKEIELNAIVKE